MIRRWIAGPLSALPLGLGCGTRSVPNPYIPDGGPEGGGGGLGGAGVGSGAADLDAGDPTLGGPCVDDGQCNDGIDCTSDRCDLTLQRCRFTPDDAPCQNTAYCDGKELCEPKLGCVPRCRFMPPHSR
jgi:hypothetical protein